MKMSEKILLKKIEQAFKENYCTGSYKLELQHDYEEASYYVLFYTYETGETISVDITVTRLGEVKFFSNVHWYYISNFGHHVKSVINVFRILFDMIDSNKDIMIKYNEIAETEETEETAETTEETVEKHYDDYTITKIENINHCPNQNTCCIVSPFVHCDYNYKSDSCIKAHKNFIHDCEQVHKQMKARSNPEWHHVSLSTLANIDNDMLDDKRRMYLTVRSELNKTLKNLRKCKSGLSYERALSPLRRWVLELYHNKKITGNFKRYVDIKISMCNVECGVWSSAVEVATGQHESRKYNRPTLRY